MIDNANIREQILVVCNGTTMNTLLFDTEHRFFTWVSFSVTMISAKLNWILSWWSFDWTNGGQRLAFVNLLANLDLKANNLPSFSWLASIFPGSSHSHYQNGDLEPNIFISHCSNGHNNCKTGNNGSLIFYHYCIWKCEIKLHYRIQLNLINSTFKL